MNHCLNCSFENAVNAKFCAKCGTVLHAETTVPAIIIGSLVGLLTLGAGGFFAYQSLNQNDKGISASSDTEKPVAPSSNASAGSNASTSASPSSSASLPAGSTYNTTNGGGHYVSKNWNNFSFDVSSGTYVSETGDATKAEFYIGTSKDVSATNSKYYISVAKDGSNVITPSGSFSTDYNAETYTVLSNINNINNYPELSPGGGNISPRVVELPWDYNGSTYYDVQLSDHTAGSSAKFVSTDGSRPPLGSIKQNNNVTIAGGLSNAETGLNDDYNFFTQIAQTIKLS